MSIPWVMLVYHADCLNLEETFFLVPNVDWFNLEVGANFSTRLSVNSHNSVWTPTPQCEPPQLNVIRKSMHKRIFFYHEQYYKVWQTQTLLHGAETWRMIKTSTNKLQTFINCLCNCNCMIKALMWSSRREQNKVNWETRKRCWHWIGQLLIA